jgi:hypothetical protein
MTEMLHRFHVVEARGSAGGAINTKPNCVATKETKKILPGLKH